MLLPKNLRFPHLYYFVLFVIKYQARILLFWWIVFQVMASLASRRNVRTTWKQRHDNASFRVIKGRGWNWKQEYVLFHENLCEPNQNKDTTRPIAPWGNDEAQASSLFLIPPRWEPTEMATTVSFRHLDQMEFDLLFSPLLTSSLPLAMTSFSLAVFWFSTFSDAPTATAKVSTNKAHISENGGFDWFVPKLILLHHFSSVGHFLRLDTTMMHSRR